MTGAPKQNEYGEPVHRLNTLLPWIDHIKEIGCTALYIGPLFESVGHGYETTDYRKLDSRLGDNEDFKDFVQKNATKPVSMWWWDGVFNHTGREFFAFQDIQKNREHSPYVNWYKGVNFGWNSPYNDGFGYEAWRNCFELVNLNLYEQAVRDYLFDVIHFWIQEFDIDGIRLDCADCLTFDFMKEMRWRTSQEKEDFWLMGEVIHGDYGRWVNDHMLHSVTNYELHKSIYSGFNDHNFFEIAHNVRRLEAIGRSLYTFVDNHDEDRIASKLRTKEHLLPVYTCLMTLPGIPSIYYGGEWGTEGKRTPSCDDALRPAISPDAFDSLRCTLTDRISKLGIIHQENEELHMGRYQELLLTNRQYAFARHGEHSLIITALNNDDNEAVLNIPVPMAASQAVNLLEDGEILPIRDGKLQITLKGCDGAVLKIKGEP